MDFHLRAVADTKQMDTESLQADLVSLRKLYRLLQISGSADGSQSSEALDEGSRRLLKRLLDCATEKLFQNHLKTLASSWRSLISVPSSVQLEAALQVHSSRLPPVSPYSRNGQGGNKNDPLPSEVLEEDASTSSVYRSHNDDTPSTTMIAPTNFTTESQNQRKPCLICERKDSRKDLVTTPRYSSHEKIQQEGQEYRLGDGFYLPFPTPRRGSAVEVSSYMNPGIEKQKIHNLRGSGSKSSRDMGEVKGKHDSSHANGFLSREVDDTVKRIESLIPSLQRLASRRTLPGVEETVSSNQEFHSFSDSTNSLDGLSVRSSTEQGCHVREADLKQIHRMGQFKEQKTNYALDKRMSASHLNNIQRVHDQTDYQRKVRTMKNLEPRSAMSPPLGSERFTDHHAGSFDNNKLDGEPAKVGKDYKIPPYKKNEFQRVHGKRSRRSKGGWASQKEPESSSCSTSDSLASRWTTTASETTCLTSDLWTEESQSTTCFSTTCEFQQGISDHKRLNAGSGGSSSSEYTASYPYSGQDSDGSDDGYYDNEVAASTSRRRIDPFRFKHKWSTHYRDQVKHEGRFRRLKDKLGLILHQRHRHRHYPDGGKYNDGYRKEHNVRSLWKQLGKIFRHVEDEERNDNTFRSRNGKAKSKKGQDKNVVAARKRVVTRKDQAGHFQSLVNGLISHMRRKKKAKDGMIARVGGRGGNTMKNTLSRMSIGGRKGKGGIGVPAMGKMKGRRDNNTRKWPQLKAVET